MDRLRNVVPVPDFELILVAVPKDAPDKRPERITVWIPIGKLLRFDFRGGD